MDTNNIVEIFKKKIGETAEGKKYKLSLSLEDQNSVIKTFEEILNENLFDGQSIVSSLKGEF